MPSNQACLGRAFALRRQCRAAGFGRCARYIGPSVGGCNFVAPFVPDYRFFEWVQSTGGESNDLGMAFWNF